MQFSMSRKLYIKQDRHNTRLWDYWSHIASWSLVHIGSDTDLLSHGTNPLPGPMVSRGLLQFTYKFEWNMKIFHPTWCIGKYHLQNVDYFDHVFLTIGTSSRVTGRITFCHPMCQLSDASRVLSHQAPCICQSFQFCQRYGYRRTVTPYDFCILHLYHAAMFLNDKPHIWMKMSSRCFPKRIIDNKSSLIPVKGWRHQADFQYSI